MFKKLLFGVTAIIFCICSNVAFASKETFIVLPFTVQGPASSAYLEHSIPQMISSKIYTKDSVEPVNSELPSNQQAVSDKSTAQKIRAKFNANYVVWGIVSVIGQDCNLVVNVESKNGKTWSYSRESKVTQLLPAINSICNSISSDVFKKKPKEVSPRTNTQSSGYKNQMNQDIIVNETNSQPSYLNPHFRYAGNSNSDDTRLRSQSLPFVAVGMEVCDIDSDGKNEVILLSKTALYAYTFNNGKLELLSKYDLPKTHEALSIRSIKGPSGKYELVINSVDADTRPKGSIWTYNSGSGFAVKTNNIPYFLNVVKVPPTYVPTLVGQKSQPPKLFRPGIYEMVKTSDGYTTGRKLSLPEEVNALNFTYLPGERNEPGSDKIIMLTPDEHLRVYTDSGKRIAQTEETYSGTSIGVEVSKNMLGLSDDKVTIKDVYYIPMRMLAVDFERDGKYELLTNRPMSTASKIFDRYRFFPQSEIQSLFWDGVGLNLQWKTRRVKGSIADFNVADVNNDGITDLVVCVNTYPGAIGVEHRKTLIMLYPLDLESTNPNTPVYIDEN